MTPTPTTPTYPITDLNLFPVYSGTMPVGTTFDPTQPQKNWLDPEAAVLVTGGFAGAAMPTYNTYQSAKPGTLPVATPMNMTAGQAAALNFPTAAQLNSANETGTTGLPGFNIYVPTPARALLPVEAIITSPMPGGVTAYIYNSENVAAQPVTDPGTLRVLAGVNALLTKEGLPNI